jgi:hypothetical protein
VWVKRGDAPPRPAGALFTSSGRVEIPNRVRPGDRVLVTAEPSGGSAMPTRPPMIVAELT